MHLQAWATCVITCSDDITSALQIEYLFTYCGQNVVACKMWSVLKWQKHGPGLSRLPGCMTANPALNRGSVKE